METNEIFILSDANNIYNNIKFIKKHITNSGDINLDIETNKSSDINIIKYIYTPIYNVLDYKYYYHRSFHIIINDNDILLKTLNAFHDISKNIKKITIYIGGVYISLREILLYFPYLEKLLIYITKTSEYNNEENKELANYNNIINVQLKYLKYLNICRSSYLPDDIDYYFPSLSSLTIYLTNINDIKDIENKSATKINRLNIYLDNNYDDDNDDIDDKVSLNIKNIIGYNLVSFYCDLSYKFIIDISVFTNSKNTIEKINFYKCNVTNFKELNTFINLIDVYLYDINIINDNKLELSLNNLLSLTIHCNVYDNSFDKVILNLPKCNTVCLTNCLNNEPIFINCKNINTILIHHNKIKELSSNLFLSTPLLEHLDCCNNKIEKISPLINKCKYLTILSLDNNNIKVLPPYLEYIESLSCANNPLLTIDNVIFKNINTIEINNTQIKKIRLNLCHNLVNLTKIICDMDKIKHISNKLVDYCFNK